ncbi:MAG: Stf0 family sulfotransferase [Paracoccus sp. (in: a-proteobacteria)]
MSFSAILTRAGIHEKYVRELFPDATTYEGPPVFDHPLYCMGFFNRSGSNLLAEYLRATPYFSGFYEQLNYDTIRNQSLKNNIKSFPDYILNLTERFSQGRPCYGFKSSVDQLMMLQRFGIPKMYSGGLRIIHITRKDLVGLAVSYQIASQNKKWTSQQKGLGEDVEICFNADQITQLISLAQDSGNGIAMYSEIFGYDRLHITYEDLVESPQLVLDQVSDFTNQQGNVWPVIMPGIQRQASALNRQFRKLYLEKVRCDIL